MAQCQFCGAEVPFKGRVPREEECPECTGTCTPADLPALRPGRPNQCRETNADWTVDKDRRNFCDYTQKRQRLLQKR